MTVPEIPANTRATAELINRVIRQANRVDTITADGHSTVSSPGGVHLRREGEVTPIAGAQRCVIVNKDPDRRTIYAWQVAAILTDSDDYNASTQNKAPGILERIAFVVQHAATGSDGQLVIAAETIPPDGAGLAYCAGVTQAHIDDDTRSAILDAGSPEIIHEEKDDAGEVVEGRLHWAVVRFGGGGARLRRIKIGGANENSNKVIDGNFRGIVWSDDDLTAASQAYDAEAPVAITDDGIGYGDLEDGSPVVVVSRQVVVDGVVKGGGMLDFDLDNDVWVTAYRQIAIPGPGDTTVKAWEAYWI